MNDIAPAVNVYTDCETGGLRLEDRPWEIAVVRDLLDGGEDRWVLYVQDFQPSKADPKALELAGFYDRHPAWTLDELIRSGFAGVGGGVVDLDVPVDIQMLPEPLVARVLFQLTRGARIFCDNPAYDVPRYQALLARHGYSWMGHYKAICMEDYAAGVAGLPAGTRNSDIGHAVGVERDAHGTVHTALADALYVRSKHRAATTAAAARAALPGAVETAMRSRLFTDPLVDEVLALIGAASGVTARP